MPYNVKKKSCIPFHKKVPSAESKIDQTIVMRATKYHSKANLLIISKYSQALIYGTLIKGQNRITGQFREKSLKNTNKGIRI